MKCNCRAGDGRLPMNGPEFATNPRAPSRAGDFFTRNQEEGA
jgi:hypothetical protein